MWGKKKIAGTVYDLTHLDQFTIYVPRSSGNPYRLRVQFGVHTFTRKYTPLDTPDLAISNGKELRAFCLERWAHSQHLPAAIRQAVSGDVLLSNGKPIIATRLPGLEGPYLIAFDIQLRSTSKYDAVLMVTSAHQRPKLDEVLPTATFPVVVSSAIAKAPVRWKKPKTE